MELNDKGFEVDFKLGLTGRYYTVDLRKGLKHLMDFLVCEEFECGREDAMVQILEDLEKHFPKVPDEPKIQIAFHSSDHKEIKSDMRGIALVMGYRGTQPIRIDYQRRIIETDRCVIRFYSYTTPDKIRGLRVDKAFGFSDETTIEITKNHKPNEPDETLFTYLSEKEGRLMYDQI